MEESKMTWKPIETAPKDGSTILLLEKGSEDPFVGWWAIRRWVPLVSHLWIHGDATLEDDIIQENIFAWCRIPSLPKHDEFEPIIDNNF
jgi:hypothetical protein